MLMLSINKLMFYIHVILSLFEYVMICPEISIFVRNFLNIHYHLPPHTQNNSKFVLTKQSQAQKCQIQVTKKIQIVAIIAIVVD